MTLEERVVKQLLELYRQGFLVLVLLLEQYQGRPSEWFYRQQMKQVLEMLQVLDQSALEWVIQQLTKIYQQNYLAVYDMLLQLGKEPDISPSFAQVHTRAIEIVAQAITQSLHGAIQTVGRQINDVYRQEALKMAGKKFTAGLTWQQAKRELEQQLLNLNITGFRDRLGRNWKLGTYTTMVARTLTREVATVATLNACKEFNIKLVKITWHAGSCAMCRPIEGKIYTLDPRDKRYPLYDGVNIRIPRHPNCAHVVTPYVDIAAELEEMEKGKRRLLYRHKKSGIIDIERRKEWSELDKKAKNLFADLPSSVVDMAKELLQRAGIKLPVYAEKIKERRYVGVDYRNENLQCIVMFLQSNDYRDYAYRQRTVFHEFYHASAQGLKHDIKGKEHFTDVYCKIEDTLAECFAHYAKQIAGISGGDTPAYPIYIATVLPALKRRVGEFKNCKTIEDFGRVAFKLRFIDKKAAWNDIYEKTKDFDVISYVKEHYLDYIEKNRDEIIEAIMENTVEPEKRDEMRETMRGWLDEAIRMVKNGEELYWMSEQIFFIYDSVAVAMKKIGVK